VAYSQMCSRSCLEGLRNTTKLHRVVSPSRDSSLTDLRRISDSHTGVAEDVYIFRD
jgi:hypothetical protein